MGGTTRRVALEELLGRLIFMVKKSRMLHRVASNVPYALATLEVMKVKGVK